MRIFKIIFYFLLLNLSFSAHSETEELLEKNVINKQRQSSDFPNLIENKMVNKFSTENSNINLQGKISPAKLKCLSMYESAVAALVNDKFATSPSHAREIINERLPKLVNNPHSHSHFNNYITPLFGCFCEYMNCP